MNWVNSHSDHGHEDSSINIVVELLIIIITLSSIAVSIMVLSLWWYLIIYSVNGNSLCYLSLTVLFQNNWIKNIERANAGIPGKWPLYGGGNSCFSDNSTDGAMSSGITKTAELLWVSPRINNRLIWLSGRRDKIAADEIAQADKLSL